jgi:hypothetical protein
MVLSRAYAKPAMECEKGVIGGGRGNSARDSRRVRKAEKRAKTGGGYHVTSVMVTEEYLAMYLIVIDLRLISSYVGHS